MNHIRNTGLAIVLLAVLPGVPLRAQTSTAAFFPEFDGYFHSNSKVQFFFQAKAAIEDGELNRAELGPSFQVCLKPLRALKDITVFDLDELKSAPVEFSIGYRVVPSPSGPTVNRMQPLTMLHVPMKGRILITDRNRADLDWSSAGFKWRYRNRVTAERRFTIHSYHPGPYASGEFLYESPYSKWASTRIYAGCLLPLGKHFQLDPYYEHENNTGERPNQQLNIGGLIFNFYFSAEKK